MKWFTRRERGEGEIQVILTLTVLVIIIGYFIFSIVRYVNFANTESELTARVLNAETKMINKTDHWFVNVQPVVKVDGVYEATGEPETIEISDSTKYGQYNSSDKYFELKNNIGAVYHFKLQGWRNPRLSEFRNVVGMEEVQGKGR